MSDLEATSSRAQSAAPITAVATGKLRAISGNQSLFAQSKGLVDAFAEVFARMAESSAQPLQAPVSIAETKDDQAVSEPEEYSDEHASTKPDATPRPVERVVDLGQPTSEVEQVDAVNEAVIAEDLVLRDEPDEVVVNDESPVSEEIVVADVEAPQADSVDSEIETPDVIAPEAVQSGGEDRSRRHRRESASARTIENTQGGQSHHHRSLPNETTDANGEEIGHDEKQLIHRPSEDDRAALPRRLRGRPRYTREATDNQPSPVSQANRTGAQQRAQSVANTAPSREPTASRSGQSDPVSSPAPAKTIESTIAHVQNVAAGANRSGAPGRLQSGARGTSQAIQSTEPSRNAVGPKPDSGRIHRNTQEMVSRIKLIQRVSKAFQHLGPDGGVVRLRLAPAELGSLRVEMRVHQRKVQARVVAETEAASTTLKEHLPDLRSRLESLGMQVDKIEIETDSHDLRQGSQFHAESQEHGQQRGGRRNGQPLHRPETETDESVSPLVSQATSVSPAHSVSSGVDVQL